MRERETPPAREHPSPPAQEYGGVDRVRTPEERAEHEARDTEQRERGITETHERLESLEVERPTGERGNDNGVDTDIGEAMPHSALARVANVARRMWQDTAYPTYERVARLSYAAFGAFAASRGAAMLEAVAVKEAFALGGLSITAAAVAEFMIRQGKKVTVSPLMVLNRTFDNAGATGRALAGEIHLNGREGLRKLRGLSLLEQRRRFLDDVRQSLVALNELAESDDARIRDCDHFYGITDVFSRRELEGLGGVVDDVEESSIFQLRRALSKQMLILQTQGIGGLFRKIGKQRTLLRVAFTREQLAAAAARLAAHTE